jgi:hypothetical protein
MMLRDVWVNWVDGNSRAHEVPQFHEWNKEEKVDLMDEIPLVVVEPELFTLLEDSCVEIPKELLQEVHRKAIRRNPETKRQNKVAYAFVVTDGARIVAIDTAGGKEPTYKSRLVPRQEQLVLALVDGEEPTKYEVGDVSLEEKDESLMGQILSFDPEYFVGLTRVEREMKEILLDCLFNLSCSENFDEVYYWYVELFPEEYSTELRIEMEPMIERMFIFIKAGWTERHVEFGTQLVKFHDIYQEEWKELLEKYKSKDYSPKKEKKKVTK